MFRCLHGGPVCSRKLCLLAFGKVVKPSSNTSRAARRRGQSKPKISEHAGHIIDVIDDDGSLDGLDAFDHKIRDR
jgi:hypothetical protein